MIFQPIKYHLTFFNSLQLFIYQYIIINFNLYTIKLLLYQIIFVYLHINQRDRATGPVVNKA